MSQDTPLLDDSLPTFVHVEKNSEPTLHFQLGFTTMRYVVHAIVQVEDYSLPVTTWLKQDFIDALIKAPFSTWVLVSAPHFKFIKTRFDDGDSKSPKINPWETATQVTSNVDTGRVTQQ